MSVPGCPSFSEEQARQLARTSYGVDGRLRALPSERDQNFRITATSGEEFVLKIANANERRGMLECQTAAMKLLASGDSSSFVPRVRAAQGGEEILSVDNGGGTHLVRLLTWLPGVMLADVRAPETTLLRDLGHMLGVLDNGLEAFAHPETERQIQWDIRNAGAEIRSHLEHVASDEDRALVQRHLDRFEQQVTPVLDDLRTGVIHNDGNDWNILVDQRVGPPGRVVGIIDFGDMVRTCTVFELAIGAAYAILDKRDPLAAAAAVACGYDSARPLTEAELAVLFPSICARLATSVCISAARRIERVGNEYLAVSEAAAWRALRQLDTVHPHLAAAVFRDACGHPPCPHGQAVVGWLSDHADEIGPVVEPPLDAEHTLVFDLGIGSPDLPARVDGEDVEFFTELLFSRMAAAGVQVGVGQYDEARRFYSSELFRPGAGEVRTIHIGIDLFLEAGAPVLAPLAGYVHSFADNRAAGDYGPAIILRHEVEGDGGALVFYTLYGHLARESLQDLEPGLPVAKGARIARIGPYPENGNWPPHLHFQLIAEMLDMRGDFPGVAPASQRAAWKGLCPDPNAVLRIPAELFPPRGMAGTDLIAARRKTIGPSLSISYRRPLKIVRGIGQYLYDDAGREYLDLVNNVCHVGHCHPQVVEAASRQMAVLNTNTRYLHDNLVQYAERLADTMPDPLQVCFFVCSGSEANELALRLARAHTGCTDFAVLDSAYHGNTSALVEISPYKFDGPGGDGVPGHVQVLPLPDVYRGPHRDPETAGVRYAADLRGAIDQIRVRGAGLAAYIAESAPGCAGQIVLPKGYLRHAYAQAREFGAVCIADEVQVGFGRVGTHFWCFETQDAVPDIVTLGKSMGNGHPLAGVVTTREIAASFANGMEYFNSAGGNPVSCAVGVALLDVIEAEGLQENALRVGERMLAGLRGLADKHPLIGDVRGLGLFVGIELVTDRGALEPAPDHATHVIERMKEAGILLSTDGPFENVLKIKPPLCVTPEDSDRLVSELDRVLGELG